MSNIDLIPAEYRSFLAKTEIVHLWLLVILSVALIMGSVSLLFHKINKMEELSSQELFAQKELIQNQREMLKALETEQQSIIKKQEIVSLMSKGIEPNKLFVNVDQALESGKVWLTKWDYQKTLIHVEGKNKSKIRFSQLKQDNKNTTIEKMTVSHQWILSGKANQYSDLFSFVKALESSPDTAMVKVTRSSPGQRSGEKLSFDIMVTLRGED